MLEALAAFSLAGTVLAFARFGSALFKDGRELYKSTKGALSANEQITLVTSDLRALLIKFQDGAGRETYPSASDLSISSETEGQLQVIVGTADGIAKELLHRLEGLKVNGEKSRKWESVRKAVQSAWNKEEIDALVKKLGTLRDSVCTNVLFSILGTMHEDSLKSSKRFDKLDSQSQLILLSLLENETQTSRIMQSSHELQTGVETLLELVRRRDRVKTTVHHTARASVSKEQVGDHRGQSSDMNEITAKFEMLDIDSEAETQVRNKVADYIKARLSYGSMTDRYEDVGDAYPETFDWAFENPTNAQLPWSDFSAWLKSGSGIYWVSGKAGSGKSTLMKHISNDGRTKRYLQMWATDENSQSNRLPLCIVKYFFWNSGSPDQKSYQGLLRALLHQAFSFSADLIPVIFPELWAKTYSEAIKGGIEGVWEPWTLRRLTQALTKLASQQYIRIKLFIMVDGLDEFDGDNEEMAALFAQATQSLDVKICLSSRPYVAFEEIYQSCPSLKLQDLTYSDIQHYTFDKFKRNPAFRRLEQQEPTTAILLQSEVVNKAQGVFLWVKIVVESLIIGIRQQDDIEILRRRLRSMPPQLDKLYQHLLNLIDPVYHEWASKAFELVRVVRDFRTDESFGTAQQRHGSTPLTMLLLLLAISGNFRLAIRDSHTAVVDKNDRIITWKELPALCETLRVHLAARCVGLLEVPRFEQKGVGAHVQFLHRTARDFLNATSQWSKIASGPSLALFDPNRAMLSSSVMNLCIRLSDKGAPSTNSGLVENWVKETLLYAYQLDSLDNFLESDVSTIDTLDLIMSQWQLTKKESKKSTHWSVRIIGELPVKTGLELIELGVLYSLYTYVHSKLCLLDVERRRLVASMLLHIYLPVSDRSLSLPTIRFEMVELLLNHGADPEWPCGQEPYQTTVISNLQFRNKKGEDAGWDKIRRYFEVSRSSVENLSHPRGSSSQIQKKRTRVFEDMDDGTIFRHDSSQKRAIYKWKENGSVPINTVARSSSVTSFRSSSPFDQTMDRSRPIKTHDSPSLHPHSPSPRKRRHGDRSPTYQPSPMRMTSPKLIAASPSYTPNSPLHVPEHPSNLGESRKAGPRLGPDTEFVASRSPTFVLSPVISAPNSPWFSPSSPAWSPSEQMSREHEPATSEVFDQKEAKGQGKGFWSVV